MNIAVYLGAMAGNNPIYREKVIELGTWIGTNGHHLVYGGSKEGLMGELSMSVLKAGGTVTGVEPRFFIESELQLDEVKELIVTETMAERRATMIARSDLFLTFPGGTGTLEEISEVISSGSLDRLDNKPYAFYNVNGYYDLMLQFYDHIVSEGFMTQQNRDKIKVVNSIEDIAELVKSTEERIGTRGE